MHPLAGAIEMFTEEAKHLLWLPALTAGYIFTVSGDPLYFALAVVGIGGARLFWDIIGSELVEQTPDGPELHDGAFEMIRDSYPWGKVWLFALVTIGYLVSAVVGIYGMYVHFDHSDLILVALATVWCGAGLIVLMNQ